MTKDQRTAARGVNLQHRHFAFIAATIAAIECEETRGKIATLFADECKATNAKFNRDRFLTACGAA